LLLHSLRSEFLEKEVKRSYVCSSSLADRLGTAGCQLVVVSRDRSAADPARGLMPAVAARAGEP
jgi:hypothetical protein